MNRNGNYPVAKITFAVFAGVLMLAISTVAYAQDVEKDKKKTDTGNIRMVISGVPGDNSDGSIEAFAIDQQIALSQSAEHSSGRPMFAVSITKGIDSASPRLGIFLATDRHLSRVTISWSKVDPATDQASAYTIILSDVLINSIHQRPANVKDPSSKDLSEYEEIAFTFGRIEWIFQPPSGPQTRAGYDIRQAKQF